MWLRRLLLEASALVVVSGVVGFLGPFGTYLRGDLMSRASNWAILLFGAYVLARPLMELWGWVARVARLPQAPLVFWGMILSSAPMALIWQMSGAPEANLIGGYAGILSFTALCSLLVMAVAWWAERADARLSDLHGGGWSPEAPALAEPATPAPTEAALPTPRGAARLEGETQAKPRGRSAPVRPRLRQRLSPGFRGDILALESEDHYVRVHGSGGSELLLLRLRDAIAEMDGLPGERTHRSWWVAQGAVSDVHARGRGCEIKLTNGERAQVARDSIDRLTRSGFLRG